MSCKAAFRMIHQYLDGDLEEYEVQALKRHIHECSQCRQHLLELEQTLAWLQALPRLRAREGMTEQILAHLPETPRKLRWIHWFKSRPFLTAAAVFLLLMFGSTMAAYYGGDQRLQVLSEQADALVIQNGAVLVPEGAVIEGDVIVRHGDIEVRGIVNGDVVAIDGNVLLASTAHIAGETEEIHQMLEWIWYKIKHLLE